MIIHPPTSTMTYLLMIIHHIVIDSVYSDLSVRVCCLLLYRRLRVHWIGSPLPHFIPPLFRLHSVDPLQNRLHRRFAAIGLIHHHQGTLCRRGGVWSVADAVSMDVHVRCHCGGVCRRPSPRRYAGQFCVYRGGVGAVVCVEPQRHSECGSLHHLRSHWPLVLLWR